MIVSIRQRMRGVAIAIGGQGSVITVAQREGASFAPQALFTNRYSMPHPLLKKFSVVAIIAFVLIVSAAIAMVFFVMKAGTRTPPVPTPRERISYSIYEGTFLSWKDNYLRVKMKDGGPIGGFITDDDTKVAEGSLAKEPPKEEVEKMITDIPASARVSIIVADDTITETPVVKKIIYFKD
jgi:hypothetical protein